MTSSADAFRVPAQNRWLIPPSPAPEAQPSSLPDPEPAASPTPQAPLVPQRASEATSPAQGATLVPLTGVAAATAKNMDASLSVPTATSLRTIPTRPLEELRSELNAAREASGTSKVSFTHLIAYALVHAVAQQPSFSHTFVSTDAKAGSRAEHDHTNLGVAVDVARPDGTRALMVPVLKAAEVLSFDEFCSKLDDLFLRARSGKLSLDDMTGATVTLTNPGTVGTISSTPRLMPGQAAIIGIGAFHIPASLETVDDSTLKALGVSRQVTITSTYDHRVIQGAESGRMLAALAEHLTLASALLRDLLPTRATADIPHRTVTASPALLEAPEAPHSTVHAAGTDADLVWRVVRLVDAYRTWGHTAARLDPLNLQVTTPAPELDPSYHGLVDLTLEVATPPLLSRAHWRLDELVAALRTTYCGTIAYEFMHLEHEPLRHAVMRAAEQPRTPLSDNEARELLAWLSDAEGFERFLAAKYVGQKRFGIEGAESFIAMLQAIAHHGASHSVGAVVLGMPHRGRLATLVQLAGKPARSLLEGFEGRVPAHTPQGSGDVKYHLGHTNTAGPLPFALLPNPSHLETVGPLVLGYARAWGKEASLEPTSVLPVIAHGDGAFAGQGVVAESFALSHTDAYKTGGALHIIVNNQVGFTTNPRDARSSRYASDPSRTPQTPVLHVNADDPEACLAAVTLALKLRRTFATDVIIDLVSYRRNGHNEGDDPSLTQPVMYRTIVQHPTVRELYARELLKRGAVTENDIEELRTRTPNALSGTLAEIRAEPYEAPTCFPRPVEPPPPPGVATHVAPDVLDQLATLLSSPPPGCTPSKKALKVLEDRRASFTQGTLDWATAELASIGSLLKQGIDVRLIGEDVRRGTFSQRHAVVWDQDTGAPHTPLGGVSEAHFEVWDSVLSEYAALGFEAGYALRASSSLVIWEAQFGDFANTAQVVIDQYLAASQEKWGIAIPLVMLLPHGFEGQGPEHSSARIERFLQLCAQNNLRVALPSTAAQHFHLLRLAALEEPRRPLVVFSPKAPLRMKESRSTLEELTTGAFRSIITHASCPDEAVTRVLLCSGKIAFDLEKHAVDHTAAVVRVESLYPLDTTALSALQDRFPNVTTWVWVQDEPANMGAWSFVAQHLHGVLPELSLVSRRASGSPATGLKYVHDTEHRELIEHAFA